MKGTRPARLDWLDPLKGLALLGILLNHLVETFGPGPWFTNPDRDWAALSVRLHHLWPAGPFPIALVRFLGWLGDSGPGVFILVSGVGLAWAASHRDRLDPGDFWRRRIRRLFPLYLLMHFVILGGAALMPGAQPGFGDPRTLLSLAGTRSTGATFFYISPSWWFVWTILQLYVLFPLLWWLYRRRGLTTFLLIAFSVTFASRILGLLAVDGLYFWMTGIFAGTRLAEFALGMVIGRTLAADPGMEERVGHRVLPWAAVTYAAGLAASLTMAGSVVASVLVAAGLSGLGYALWRRVRRHHRPARALTWIGTASFAVFLLHQPPLSWTGHFFDSTGAHLAAALGVLALCFPAGVLIEGLSERLMGYAGLAAARSLTWIVAPPLLASVLFRTRLSTGSRSAHVLEWAMAAGLAVLAALALADRRTGGQADRADGRTGGQADRADRADRTDRTDRAVEADRLSSRASSEGSSGPRSSAFANTAAQRFPFIALWGIAAGAIGLFLLPPAHGLLALVAGLLFAVMGSVLPARHLALAAGTSLAFLLVTEAALRQAAPLEVGGWGELPALEAHPTRVFGLKPNRTTHLRYNRSDYTITTNSLGLSSPEVTAERPTPDTWRVLVLGDAFAMPEGLNREAGFPALLQQHLQSCMGNPVEVINGGVTGYGPPEELAQARELVPRFRPDAVILEFFVNDWDDLTIDPDTRRRGIGLETGRQTFLARVLRHSQLAGRVRRITNRIPDNPDWWERRWGLLQFYRPAENRYYTPERIALMRDSLAQLDSIARSVRRATLPVQRPRRAGGDAAGKSGLRPARLDARFIHARLHAAVACTGTGCGWAFAFLYPARPVAHAPASPAAAGLRPVRMVLERGRAPGGGGGDGRGDMRGVESVSGQ